jgi:hypothetical protein
MTPILTSLTQRAMLATNRLVAAAAVLGVSPAEPERLAVTLGGLMVRQMRDYLRRRDRLS